MRDPRRGTRGRSRRRCLGARSAARRAGGALHERERGRRRDDGRAGPVGGSDRRGRRRPEAGACHRCVCVGTAVHPGNPGFLLQSPSVTTRLLLLAAVVAGIASGSSPGARLGSTVFVAQQNPRCSDAGKGSASQPFCSISGAALKVTPGSTVVIASGTYTGPVILQTSGTRHAPIVFRPKPGATVLLTGKSGFSLSGVSWITISGFTITRTVGYGISVVNGSHAVLRIRHPQPGFRPTPPQARSASARLQRNHH